MKPKKTVSTKRRKSPDPDAMSPAKKMSEEGESRLENGGAKKMGENNPGPSTSGSGGRVTRASTRLASQKATSSKIEAKEDSSEEEELMSLDGSDDSDFTPDFHPPQASSSKKPQPAKKPVKNLAVVPPQNGQATGNKNENNGRPGPGLLLSSESSDSEPEVEVVRQPVRPGRGLRSAANNNRRTSVTRWNLVEVALGVFSDRSSDPSDQDESDPSESTLDESDEDEENGRKSPPVRKRKMPAAPNGKESRAQAENIENLEDSSDESDVDEKNISNNSSKSLPVIDKATSILHSRPVDYTFTNTNKGTVPESSGKEKAGTSSKGEIEKLLAVGENKRLSNEMSESMEEKSNEDSSDESSVDWEEVEEGSAADQNQPYSLPSEGVVVTLPNEGMTFNRKKGKKEFDVNEWIRKQRNQDIRELQVLLHKTNLLCLLARGMLVNNWLCSDDILAIALSTLPSQQAYPPKHLDLSYLERFLKWFKKTYTFQNDIELNGRNVEEDLKTEIISKKCTTVESGVFIFIAILRSLGVATRLMWSLQPIPLKPPSESLIKPPPKAEDETAKEKKAEKSTVQKLSSSKTKKVIPVKKPKKSGQKEPSRKIISSEEEEDITPVKPVIKQGRDFWAEVFLEEEERWVSVDITTGKVLCDSEFEGNSTQPMSYVLAFDNMGRVKDLTRRYALRWLTATQKIRVESDWWNSSLKPFRGRRLPRDKDEDEYLDQQLMAKPIPKSFNECKGHPLFVIRPHLLKFEAIYPLEPMPLGYIKKEPVFSRECVKILHTRELWTRKAKVVRIGEVPYKVVKARPKYDRLSNQIIKDLPLELFGEWQVEDFVPPTAKDGKVPRNPYGNVELFEIDKMLPKGTIHLQLPGLNRVAKKLNIDCAPALTGFDYHHGGSHPVFDGFVVCEEFKEILLDAWNQEQDEQRKKDEEKRQKRVYGNWAKLLKGLLIKQKLETKYSHMFTKRKVEDTEDDGDKPTSSSAPANKRQKK